MTAMKKKIFAVFFAVAIALLLAVSALADNRVAKIEVDVTLYPDGSAYVEQTWEGSFSEGTECYFPLTNLGEMTLSGLTVSDGKGRYQTLPQWDVKASFDAKARKCGLVPKDDGYEVCWGISEYGDNRYTVAYKLGGLVGAYDDADGFLFQFVPSGMSTLPTDVSVHIEAQDVSLTKENAAVWGFGFAGQLGFTQGDGVSAYTEKPLSKSSDSVIILLQLQKGVLKPTRRVSGSFEAVKERAFKGSDYGKDSSEGLFIFLLCVVPIMIGLLIWLGGKEARAVKRLYAAADYFRDTPLEGNLEAAHAMARQFYQSKDDGDIIAATLIKLLSQGCLDPIIENNAGFMGGGKEKISLRLLKPPAFRSVTAKSLYELLTTAAGGDDILQERELENYCKKHYQALLSIVQSAQQDGRETLVNIGCYQSARSSRRLASLTERGLTRLKELLGLKKYLLDFSLIGERGVSEAIIWQDYLIFAALLGIADKVMEQLKKLYPDASVYQRQAQTAYIVAYRYHHITYQTAKSAQSQAQRSAGGGGRASIGGGGGFSGGGHGGGTR